MSSDPADDSSRIQMALAAIRRAFGTADDEYGVTLFVSHHLEEVEGSYWEQHLQTPSPGAQEVLGLLEPSPSWSKGEDGSESIDFTLPGGVTDYVLCVRFDDTGEVEEITMES